jgi:DNA-binding transcriptional MerR regulator
MHRNHLYRIGDVARWTGHAVSAIRFYADQGIVAPSAVDRTGRRQFDLRAVAQLDLIRTLRQSGAGLDEIRQRRIGEMGLREVLARHLDAVELLEHDLRTRRGVLEALTSQDDPAPLLRRLITTPDTRR